MAKVPTAVLLSDVHYSIQTLEVADKATRMAIAYSNDLGVPLVVCGDLHDTKANLRGECVSAMIETFKRGKYDIYVLRGNHDQINEKSDEHSLQFLTLLENVAVIDVPTQVLRGEAVATPYHHDADELRQALTTIPKDAILIMHQGILGSEAGHYIQDKSALSKEDLAGRRVISGHYHRRQTLELPGGGTFDYVGNPYTLGFGEANDPEKGFQVLYSDGSLEFVPTNLRKHVVVTMERMSTVEGWNINYEARDIKSGDLVWVKCTAPSDIIAGLNKEMVAKITGYNFAFRLDLIPTDSGIKKVDETKNMSQAEILDAIIDASNSISSQKEKLKGLWKQLV